MNREDRKKVTATKEECPEEQCKNLERRTVPGNSKEAYDTLKALIKQDPIAKVSSHRRQQRKNPDGKQSCSDSVD